MPKILVVDTEAGMRSIIDRILSPRGYEISSADDGAQALDAFRKTLPELVLLDVSLPDMESADVMKELKAIKAGVQFIVLSGPAEKDAAQELVKSGAYAQLAKPFRVDDLVQLVKKAVPAKKEEPAVPAPPPAPKKSRLPRILGFVVLAGVLAACGFFGLQLFRGPEVREFMVPQSHLSALAVSGRELWCADWSAESVCRYAISATPALRKEYLLPDIAPSGMAFDGKNLWISHSLEGKIYKLRVGTELVVESVYDSPGPSPSGLYTDGMHLWSLDFQQGKIYQHALDDRLTVTAVFDSIARNPRAISRFRESFYVADAATNRLYRLEGPELSLKAVYEFPASTQHRTLASLTAEGKYLWACFEGEKTVYRCRMAGLRPAKW